MKEEGGVLVHSLPAIQTEVSLRGSPTSNEKNPASYLSTITDQTGYTFHSRQVTIRMGMVPCSTFHTNLGEWDDSSRSHGPNQCEQFTPCTLINDLRWLHMPHHARRKIRPLLGLQPAPCTLDQYNTSVWPQWWLLSNKICLMKIAVEILHNKIWFTHFV